MHGLIEGIDPTTMRLSEHFLLSDFLGCSSVYREGYPNLFDGSREKLAEGKILAQYLLEPLLQHSRLSISYGYISPELSRLIVKYQDPDKRSYHRWDAGAACDVVLHDSDLAPVYEAFWIDENLPVSRTITYSESPFICVSTRREEIERGDARRALYENRYVGQRKPVYINYSGSPQTRRTQKQSVELAHPWQGAGYPTYHGGGVKQYHHTRTSRFTVLSDFLYSDDAVSDGLRNRPPIRPGSKFLRAGQLYDQLLEVTGLRRMSIVRGYESPEWAESVHNWKDGIYLVLVPPASASVEEVVEAAEALPGVRRAKVGRDHRVLIAADLDYEGTEEVPTKGMQSPEEAPPAQRRRTRRHA